MDSKYNAPVNSADHIKLLGDVIEDIASELPLEPLLTRIIERLCRLIGADDGSIGLYIPELDIIRIAAVYKMPARELGSEIPRGVGLAGLMLERSTSIRARYGDLPNILLPELADNSILAMPIRIRGTLIGFFGVGAWPPKILGEAEENTLEHFATYAAVAIDNAKRYGQEKRKADRFALISKVAALIASGGGLDQILQRAADLIHEVLEFPNVDIPIIEESNPTELVIRYRGGKYKELIKHEDRVPIGSGIIGAAALTKTVQRVADVRLDSRYIKPPNVEMPWAEMAVPIMYGIEVLGVVNVEGDSPFDDLDQESLEIVAEHLAVAINNARMHEQATELALMEDRHRLARELHDNITQVLSSISLISQSLSSAWHKDPTEGERLSLRLGQLSQMAFSELRILLKELSPIRQLRHDQTDPLQNTMVGTHLLAQFSLPIALSKLLGAMVCHPMRLKLNFHDYIPQTIAVEETLLRVSQESLSNALRHANPMQINITGRVDGEFVYITISDDGIGIRNNTNWQGLGIPSMRRRMHDIGGSLKIEANLPSGTSIQCVAPRADR